MKKRRIILSTLFVILMTTTVFASNYKVKVKGITIDTSIKLIDNRSMISLRNIGEALGLEVSYDKEANRVLLDTTYGNMGNLLVLNLDTGLADSMVWGDGDLYEYERNGLRLEVSPTIIDGSVYVPLRFVCDIFGSPVHLAENNIVIGELFSSGLVTARLDVDQKKLSSSSSVLNYEKYKRDASKLLAMNDDIHYGRSELAYAPDYLGSEGQHMSAAIMAIYSTVTDMNMETIEGHKAKQTCETLLFSLGNQYSDLGNHKIPSDASVEYFFKIEDQLGVDLDAFVEKMDEAERKSNN